MSELYELTASELVSAYASGALSPVEATRSILDRADTVNPSINALVFMNPDKALAEAAQSEMRWKAGKPLGPIDGVPVSVKDSIAVKDIPMLRGNKANEGAPPSAYDAPPSMRLKESGAIIFAKTTMPDFGLLAAGVSSAFGITRNPWDLSCNPGGSSSGASAATASYCGPLSVGSDIGGSVRFPAAMCGLVGLKPSQGRIPHLPPSPVRSAGPITRNVEDNGLLLQVLAGTDIRDYGSLPPATDSYMKLSPRDLKGVRILLVMEGDNNELPEPGVLQCIREAVSVFESAGAIVEEKPCVIGNNFMETAAIPLILRGLAEFLKQSEEKRARSPEHFQETFGKAAKMTADKVALALEELEVIKARVLAQMAGYDFLISPMSGMSAFPADVKQPQAKSSNAMYTPIWNQTGNPALSICCGFDPVNNMPVGLQIVGHRFDDLGVLELAKAYEDIRGFEMNWPTPVA